MKILIGFIEKEIAQVGREVGIEPFIIRDQDLERQGFGGIYGVGKASTHPPALAVLSHTPKVTLNKQNCAIISFKPHNLIMR